MSDATSTVMGPELALVSDRLSALRTQRPLHVALVDEFGWDPTEPARESVPDGPPDRSGRTWSWLRRGLGRGRDAPAPVECSLAPVGYH